MPQVKQDPIQKKLAQLDRESEERDTKRRAERSGIPYVDMAKVPVSLEAIKLISEEDARAANMAAIEQKTDSVAVVATDPRSEAVQKIIKKLEVKGTAVKVFLVSKSSLEQVWYYYKFVAGEKKEITGKVAIEKEEFDDLLKRIVDLDTLHAEIGKIESEKMSTTKLLEIVLAGAMNNRASDIHFEAEEKSARARLRIDGILHDIYEIPPRAYESLVTRIKLLCGLKMNVHGEPQDGRFGINFPTKEVEMRVSIIPSEFGETIVMRILDPDAIKVDLPTLGLRKDDYEMVLKELERPNGLILNTGPTGSGKTTTLYAFLRHLASPEDKIITVEDPIEYQIDGIEQTQVNPEVGYTFAGGLRAILRQDPDAILVGEIRDFETADMAMQASLTGHMVLSTLHTNDAVGAVPRLVDLGIKPQTIGPALTLVIAQRLVRKLCEKCKKPMEMTPELKTNFEEFLKKLPEKIDREKYKNYQIYQKVGCKACNNFGYKGRIGVFEFFHGGPEMEEVILKQVSDIALKEIADKQGMVTMQEDGILKIFTGQTTFEEVEGSTGQIDWQKLLARK